MSGPSGTWTTTSGSSGDNLVALVAVIAPCVVLGAVAVVVAKAIESIPIYVWALAAVAMVTGIAAFARFMVRSNRRQAAAFAARREQDRALEAAEREDRRRHRLEVAAASAPVIHNWIVPEQVAAARERGFTPTTIFTGQKEIQR
jgi:hypothetical protein